MPFLFAGLGATYSFLPTEAPGLSLSAGALAAEAGLQFQLSRAISLRLRGDGGYFAAARNGASGETNFNPYFAGGAGVGLEVSRTLSLEAGAAYRSYYGLYGGISAGIGVAVKLGEGGSRRAFRLLPGYDPIQNLGRGLSFAGVKLDSVFPVFFKHYDDHPIGRVLVHNFETQSATGIRAEVNVKRYMDEAKGAGVPLRVAAGASGELLLYGLFKEDILEIVEATKLPISVTLEYSQYGQSFKETYVGTLDVLDRNAITWDDDRKAAAFISSKDPSALAYAKGIAVATKELLNPAVNQNLQIAMAIHEALRVQKFAYVKDPTSALETNNKQVVDFIQFPRQTLGYRSGKCSDLTVLYCSLLESVGLPTALITTPGHILMAVDLEMSPEEAAKTFLRPEDLIVRDDKVWLPLETTERKGGFVAAWREGARQWRESSTKNDASFLSVREAWKEYQPVVYPGDGEAAVKPDTRNASAAFKAELAAYVSAELGTRVAAIQAELKKQGSKSALLNRLGVLYARYGQLDKAEEQFSAALAESKSSLAAVFNMGNILYLRGKYPEALAYYGRILKASPDHPQALVSSARANAALGKYGESLAAYERLRRLDPKLAAQFAYLGAGSAEGSRAAEVERQRGNLLWQD